MIRVLITLPHTFEEEVRILENHAEQFDKIHLRKENWSEIQTSEFMDKLSDQLVQRMVLCDHYHLVMHFDAGGIHMKESKRNMDIGKFRKGTVSSSFHDLDTLKKTGPDFDYALFGPVYPSFSKTDYMPSFSREDMQTVLLQTPARVVGIGGMEEDKIPEMESLGFAGIAFYTSFWKQYVEA